MSNEYNYYNPNPEDFDHNNIFDEQPKQEKPKKPQKKMPKWAGVVGLALVFGIVASAAFQASNVVFDRVTGNDTKTVKQSSTSGNTQLTQTASTVFACRVNAGSTCILPTGGDCNESLLFQCEGKLFDILSGTAKEASKLGESRMILRLPYHSQEHELLQRQFRDGVVKYGLQSVFSDEQRTEQCFALIFC